MVTKKDIDYSDVPQERLEAGLQRITMLRRTLLVPPVLGLTLDEVTCLNSAALRLGEAEKRMRAELERRATPQYQHDCPECTFLGRYQYNGESYDLYHCLQGGRLPTLLARYSSQGPDYHSGMEFGRLHASRGPLTHMLDDGTTEVRPADPAAPLGEAYRRAHARGLALT